MTEGGWADQSNRLRRLRHLLQPSTKFARGACQLYPPAFDDRGAVRNRKGDVNVLLHDDDRGATGGPALQLYLSPRATDALAQSSGRYVEQYLAVVADDRIICCLFVHSPLSNQLIILGDSEALPMTRLDEIAARINARGTVSPTP